MFFKWRGCPLNLAPSFLSVRGIFSICGTFVNILEIMADKELESYERKIRAALRRHNLPTSGLEIQIRSLATALRTLDKANLQIAGLDEVTVWEKTRYGEKLAPHPVFKVAHDAEYQITRQMKALGLTADNLSVDAEKDPLTEMTAKLNDRRSNPVIVRPS